MPVPAPEPVALQRKKKRRPASTVQPLLFRCAPATCRQLPRPEHEQISPPTVERYARTDARKRARACAFDTRVAISICSSFV